MNQNDLRRALTYKNVQAFYMVVRKGESGLTDEAYSMVNGGGRFFDFSRHPYEGLSTRAGGRAAGAPQFIPSTWGELADKYGFTDFTPASQDMGYVGCLIKRNALDDVIAGRFDLAVEKCELEWTSLPGASENNPAWNLQKARALYQQYGGTFSGEIPTQPAAPIEEREIVVNPPQEKPMGALALLNLFAPILSGLIPQIKKFITPGSEVAQRNTAIAETILNTITTAANAPNLQGAIEKMQSEPEVKKAVQQAIVTEPEIMQVMEVAGGFAKAREQDILQQKQDQPFYKTSAVFWISIVLLPLVYWLVGSLIVGGALQNLPEGTTIPDWMKMLMALFGREWEGETRSGGFNLIVGLVLGGICGVYFGVSVTQNKQQQQANVEKST